MNKIFSLLEQDKYADALPLITTLLDSQELPEVDKLQYLRVLALIHIRTGSLPNALKALNDGLEIDPFEGSLHYTKGVMLTNSGETHKAQFHLRMAWNSDRGNPEFRQALTDILSINGHTNPEGELERCEHGLKCYFEGKVDSGPAPDAFGERATHTEELLSNAKQPICIVGNGWTGHRFGKVIDSYSTVIRMNNYRIDGYEEYVGSKTDFRCVSGWTDVENRNEHPEFTPFAENSRESANLELYNKGNNSPVITPRHDYKMFISEVENPSTGFTLIQLLNTLGIKADLFGFDGFKTNHYWNDSEDIKTTHSRNELEYILKRDNIVIHNEDEKSPFSDDFYINLFLQDPSWSSPVPNDDERARWHFISPLFEEIATQQRAAGRSVRILDLGCGRGWLTNLCSQFGECEGLEPVSEVANCARFLYPGLLFRAGTSQTILKNEGFTPYDVVVNSEVIEHVPREQHPGFVRDITKLLSAGGNVIITTPRAEVYEKWFENKYNVKQPVENWLMEKEVEELFVGHGFKTVKMDRIYFDLKKESFVCQPPRELLDSPHLLSLYQVWHFKLPQHGAADKCPSATVDAPPIPSPKISVVLPTYNRPGILEECLEGFARQTIPRNDFEVVVVDDGSEPPVEEVAAKFSEHLNIVYRFQTNSGLAAARNACIKQASATILALHDDDDVPAPDFLERCLHFHGAHPDEADILLAQVAPHPDLEQTPLLGWVFDGANGIIGFPDPRALHDFWSFYGGTSSCKKSLFRYGLCNPEYRFGFEDTELAIRINNQIRLRVHYDPLTISYLIRPPDFAWMFKRSYREGRSHHRLYDQHGDMTLVGVGRDALESMETVTTIGASLEGILKLVATAENTLTTGSPAARDRSQILTELHTAYFLCRKYGRAKGWVDFADNIDENIGLRDMEAMLGNYSLEINKSHASPPQSPVTTMASKVSGKVHEGKNLPAVSVVVPCYNHGKHLFKSVSSVILQTFQQFEVIIVNDGSTDDSIAVAAKLITDYPDIAIRLINQENSGKPAIARNRGITEAKGNYIICLDADDMIMPTMLEECVRLLENNPGISIAYTDQIHFNNNLNLYVDVAQYDFSRLLQGNFIGCCSMFRRQAWLEVGGYPTNVGYEDWDFWISCGEKGHYGKHIPKALFCYQLNCEGQYVKDLQMDALNKAKIILNHPSLYNEQTVQDAVAVVKSAEVATGKAALPFRVASIISAHNEGDVIYHVIGDLVSQGIEVYLINHCSTDNTVEEASRWLGKGLVHIENFPQDAGYPEANNEQYIWHHILRRKEELAAQLDADWFIHSDADEFRESPWPGLTLKEAIRVADSMGYNALDFELLNFRPVDNCFVPGTDVRKALRNYEGCEDFNAHQIKAWKNLKIPVSIFQNGGHNISFEGRRVSPVKFLLRHYPIRSQVHGEQKVFIERKKRFNAEERQAGWHVQYDTIKDERHNFLYNPADLTPYDGDQVRLRILSVQAQGIAAAFSRTKPATDATMTADITRDSRKTGHANQGKVAGEVIPSLIEAANALTNEGNVAEATELYRQALAADPDNCPALVGIGVVKIIGENYSEAAIAFSRALKTSPVDVKALCGLGLARSGQGRRQEGFELFKKALASDPENLTALHELLKSAYELDRLDEAEPDLQNYLMYHPADSHMIFSLAGLRFRMGKHVAALDVLEQLLALVPDYEGGAELAERVRIAMGGLDGEVRLASGA